MGVEGNQDKKTRFKEIIRKTILAIQRYKNLDIILAGDLNCTIDILNNMYNIVNSIAPENEDASEHLNNIETQITNIFKNYGTEDIVDMIGLVLGKVCLDNYENNSKFDLITRYVHPVGYRLIIKNNMNVSSSDHILCNYEPLTCLDVDNTNSKFQQLVYGIRVVIALNNKVMIITGIADDIGAMFLDDEYIMKKRSNMYKIKIDMEYNTVEFHRYIETLSLKEYLIYTEDLIVKNFISIMQKIEDINNECLSNTIDEFVNDNLFNQRIRLIQLLIKDDAESKYLAYLLYDLLSNENNGVIDTYEQTLLYDSLPWILRKYFNEAMKQTVQYTNNLNNNTNSKLPLEQQICLMKVNDTVKEKAMAKLKEIRTKSEDTGAKAKQYLDGLLKVPFGIYREEMILKMSKIIKKGMYTNIDKIIKNFKLDMNINKNIIKNNYELETIYNNLLEENVFNITDNKVMEFIENLKNNKRPQIIKIINTINGLIKKEGIKMNKLIQSGKNSKYLIESINDFIENNKELCKKNFYIIKDADFNVGELDGILKDRTAINNDMKYISSYIDDIGDIMDKSVYGHVEAKRQIQRIIGQWISGKNTGYCFGFEGPPGVGKTSLAKKGLANCLKDENGTARPFSFIAMGGSSNGSVFEGHSYTYVGSTWGKMVDILIDSKCMNPIIFIDELDKVSRTENGKEIVGILTHLIDTTQNDKFQDKYFTGIDLDLSKALFIFSYNDVELIDKILLDRIHRIKFDYLMMDDKLKITRQFLLPDMYGKMGLENIIEITDAVVEFIIETYTNESGVRKLKELLFEIMGEININILKGDQVLIPIIITKEDIEEKYLKNHNFIIKRKVASESKIGVINGLWANSQGCGGILPIEVTYNPSTSFLDLKLTGLQGDVMKESMNVAKTVAYNLLTNEERKECDKELKDSTKQGLHIHCPEGAVPKDGPSAGAAITLCIYSLLTKKKIRNNVAITGEITLQGIITAIGGLDLKILGGIKNGVEVFLYPKENERDFIEFMSKNKNKIPETITFISVDNIIDAINNIIL